VVAEKTAKNFRGLLFLAAPCTAASTLDQFLADPTNEMTHNLAV